MLEILPDIRQECRRPGTLSELWPHAEENFTGSGAQGLQLTGY